MDEDIQQEDFDLELVDLDEELLDEVVGGCTTNSIVTCTAPATLTCS